MVLDNSVSFDVPGFTYEVYHSESTIKQQEHKLLRLQILKIDSSDYDREAT